MTTKAKASPEVEVPIEEVQPTYTVREKKIDRYSTSRQVIEVGPVTCSVCGYDPVNSNQAKFMAESYEELDDEGKMVARNIFKKHMASHHSPLEIEVAAVRNKGLKP